MKIGFRVLGNNGAQNNAITIAKYVLGRTQMGVLALIELC